MKNLLPTFRKRPNTNGEYYLNEEIAQLPFQFNLGDAPFTRQQIDQ